MTGFERRWVATIAGALAPRDALAAAGLDIGQIDIGARYAAEQAAAPWSVALLLRLAVWVVWLAPVWSSARPRSFGSLDEAARVALLERLLKHRRYAVRMLMMVLKLTLCQELLGDTATLLALGAYDLPRTLHKRGVG